MRKENATINTKFISEPGSYLKNADYFAFVELNDYACYCIADGIDIDDRKESARLAVTTVIAEFSENPGMSSRKLKNYMKKAHQVLLQEANEIRLEASIVIMVTDYKKVRWAHAGNSRLCWMRNGMIKFTTKDTSLTQRMVDQEEIALDQVSVHEERNNLYCYLGQPGHFTPVVSGKKTLADGDILLLETRGVWENIGDAEFIDAIDGVSKPDEVCVGLEDVILSRQSQIIENYTIATVFIDKVYHNPKAGRNKKIMKIAMVIGIAVFAIVFGLFMARYRSNKNNLAKMDKAKVKGIGYLDENNYSAAKEQFQKAYESGEQVKASVNSQKGRMVTAVEDYDTMCEHLVVAVESMNKGSYKEANQKFGNAYGIAISLKNDYEEDIESFIDGIVAYRDYTGAMQEASVASGAQDYDNAVRKYQEAASLMKDIEDITNEDIALQAQKNANAQNLISMGAKSEQEGDSFQKQGNYSMAKGCFESAKADYEAARDTYGSDVAGDKLTAVGLKLDSVQANINNSTTVEKRKEASSYVALGDEAAHKGNDKEALEFYNKAKDIYQETGDNEQLIALDGKINTSKFAGDEDAAMELFMKGVNFIVDGDNVSAVTFLKQAADEYKKLNDEVMVAQIKVIISKLS